MKLEEIYQPIADDLKRMENLLESSVREGAPAPFIRGHLPHSSGSIPASIINSLLEFPGKRLRPALVILSEKAASAGKNGNCDYAELITLATAVELIHIASLIHDDVLDKATMRHSRPSINTQYGDDISIVLADYIYSKAFQLIANCRNPQCKTGAFRPDIFVCISEAIYLMCEGELVHVASRGNLDLSKNSYIVIAKKKTASLFAACCHAGTIIGNHSQAVQRALKEFGLNFGVAFQIIDDCKDFLSEESELGKCPGQDIIAGDITLPLLTLSEVLGRSEREELQNMLGSTCTSVTPTFSCESKSGGAGEANDNASTELAEVNFTRLRAILINSNALSKVHEVAKSYLSTAKKHLDSLADSVYKESLNQLVDCTTQLESA